MMMRSPLSSPAPARRPPRGGRRQPRGMTLLIALGVIAVATAATLVSLRIVSQESELQGRERHSREAFFAAEAGLAEGREVLKGLLGADPTFGSISASPNKGVFMALSAPHKGQPGFNSDGEVSEPGFIGNYTSWFEVIPSTRYSLLPTTGGALDATYGVARREMRDANNKPFVSFPQQAQVAYRVFVHDNNDEAGSGADDLQQDVDRAVWLVSVGEVTGGSGEVLARSVVRALVVGGHVPALGDAYSGQKGGSSDKAGDPLEQTPPDASKGGVL